MTDLILKTADEISQEAFAAMVNSYMKNGTPFLGMTSPNDYEAFLRMCRAHESGKRLAARQRSLYQIFYVRRSGRYIRPGRRKALPFRESHPI